MKLDGMSDGSEKKEDMEKEAAPSHEPTDGRANFLFVLRCSFVRQKSSHKRCVRRRRARNDWRREGRSRAEGGRTSVSCWRDSQMI